MNTLDTLEQQALDYHAQPMPGKIGTSLLKKTDTQHDLALAYSPGVAEPVKAIAANPEDAYRYTNKGNLVAVISNGSAILGLGNLGPLASKPVMEGKAVLFKRFADIDVYDLEVNAKDPEHFIDIVASLAPSFGGINLEDIKAPDCFKIEEALQAKLDIPVFHDDQHGTAITIAAALQNACIVQQQTFSSLRICILGAGASALATASLLATLGIPKTNITLLDSRGVIHDGRDDLNVYKQAWAHASPHRDVYDACQDSDVFIGLAGAVIEKPEQLIASMPDHACFFVLSNPTPEIQPELIKQLRPHAIVATGRSDYPNQVNNVLCFPYIFRGALDARSGVINDVMKKAAVEALVQATALPETDLLRACYPNDDTLSLSSSFILPKPLDTRLKTIIPEAVKQAALSS